MNRCFFESRINFYVKLSVILLSNNPLSIVHDKTTFLKPVATRLIDIPFLSQMIFSQIKLQHTAEHKIDMKEKIHTNNILSTISFTPI